MVNEFQFSFYHTLYAFTLDQVLGELERERERERESESDWSEALFLTGLASMLSFRLIVISD